MLTEKFSIRISVTVMNATYGLEDVFDADAVPDLLREHRQVVVALARGPEVEGDAMTRRLLDHVPAAQRVENTCEEALLTTLLIQNNTHDAKKRRWSL